MPPQHPRPGETHDILHRFAFGGAIAVDRALAARGLQRAEWTPLQPLTGVLLQPFAILADASGSLVVMPAVQLHHGQYGPVVSDEVR